MANSSFGVKRSVEFKEKVRQNSLNMSDKTREKIRVSLTGLKQSKETIDKRVKKLIGRKGGMCGKEHNESTKLKMSNSHKKNVYKSSYKLGSIPHNRKTITQLTLNGDFIRKWDSLKDIRLCLKISSNNVSLVCRNKLETAGNYKWKYEI